MAELYRKTPKFIRSEVLNLIANKPRRPTAGAWAFCVYRRRQTCRGSVKQGQPPVPEWG